ncbi:MAG: FG-GAP-like repeat-containing protein [Bacteroidota bacterium]
MKSRILICFFILISLQMKAQIAGSDSVCIGYAAAYKMTPVPGTVSYLWTVPAGTFISYGQNTDSIYVLFGTTSGDVTVKPLDISGNGTTYVKNVFLRPRPNVFGLVSPSKLVCAKSPITLSGSGASTYIWSNGVSNGVSFAAPLTSTEGLLSFQSHFFTLNNPQSIVSGDVDGDGKRDVIVGNYSNSSISIFRNKYGSTSVPIVDTFFDPKVNVTTGSGPQGIAIEDFDGDGKNDIVVLNYSSNTVSVLRNIGLAGSLSLAAKVDFATGVSPLNVVVMDVDGDGKKDIVTVNQTGNTVSVLRNTSVTGFITSSSFAAKVDFAVGNSPFDIAAGDINNDGKEDIIVTNSNSNTISILQNNSVSGTINSSSFAAKVDFITGTYPYNIAVADIDRDNKKDIITTNLFVNTFSVLKNIHTTGTITTGSLQAKVDFNTNSYPTSLLVDDIDGDNKNDIAITSDVGVIKVHRNAGLLNTINANSFLDTLTYFIETGAFELTASDLDNDGIKELLITNVNNNIFKVYKANFKTYTVTGTDAYGCVSNDIVSIVLKKIPTVVIVSATDTICNGYGVALSVSGANSYVWSPSTGLNNTVGAAVMARPIVTTQYTAVGTLANGCSNKDSTLITVFQKPVLAITSSVTTPVCAYSPVTLTASGASYYSWYNGISNGVAFNPSSTASYIVMGTDSNGCSNIDSIRIFVKPLPTIGIQFLPSDSVCAGSPLILSGTGASTYTWSGGVSNGVAFIPPSPGVYTVSGTDSNGCSNIKSAIIYLKPLPAVKLSVTPDNIICAGQSIYLNATGATKYTGDSGVVGGTAIIPAFTQKYKVIGTDTISGCSNTDSVTVTVNQLPIVGASTFPADSICKGSSVTLTGTGAKTYTWNKNVNNGVSFSPLLTNTYIVTGTDSNGCSNSYNQTVKVNLLPVVSAVVGPDSIVCKGSAIVLNGIGTHKYSWPDNVINGEPFVIKQTKQFTVIGTDTTTGCTNIVNKLVTVKIAPLSILANPAGTVCIGDSVTLTAQGANTFTWDKGVINGKAFIVTATNQYKMVGTDNISGCTDTVIQIVNTFVPAVLSVEQMPADKICSGTFVKLIGSGAHLYTWSDDIVNDHYFTINNAHTYTLTAVDFNGCKSTTTKKIDVLPKPSITINVVPSAVVCAGTLVKLSGVGAKTYTWNGGITNNTYFLPVGNTQYTITGTDSNGCTNTANQTVKANAAPAILTQPTGVSASEGSNAKLSLVVSGSSVLYQWQIKTGSNFINLSNNTKYAGVNTNELTISNVSITQNNEMYRCYISSNSCADTSNYAYLSVSKMGTQELLSNAYISVFPNPTSGKIVLKHFSKEPLKYAIHDELGRTILTDEASQEETAIDISHLGAGVYFMYTDMNTKEPFKLVKY